MRQRPQWKDTKTFRHRPTTLPCKISRGKAKASPGICFFFQSSFMLRELADSAFHKVAALSVASRRSVESRCKQLSLQDNFAAAINMQILGAPSD